MYARRFKDMAISTLQIYQQITEAVAGATSLKRESYTHIVFAIKELTLHVTYARHIAYSIRTHALMAKKI